MAAEIPGWTHVYSGKVRDLYEPAGPGAGHPGDVVLVVASDRISAYDHVLPTPIPDKGAVLTALSLWWFETLGVPHHVVSTDVPDAVAGRAMSSGGWPCFRSSASRAATSPAPGWSSNA